MVGERLSHYQVTEKIGAGGMGVVYRAHDEQLERDVAIKVLPAGILADDNARKRFRKEALALAKLNHPNIATIYEFGSEQGIDFLVTEYIPGTTLDEKLLSGSLTPKETIALGSQLAEGLAAAHEQGVVHRDLKPGNLRITPDGRLKILDFGLAHLMPQGGNAELALTLSESQQAVGTLPYMAPEQLRGEPCDARTDIWAAGAVLYELSTGQRPFPERVGTLLIDSILHQPPSPPSKLNRRLSPGLESVILKALDKDPARRYQSTRELGVDLERLAAGVAPVAAPKSQPALFILVPLLTLLLLAAALGGYWFSHRKPPAPPSRASDVSLLPAGPPRRSVAVLGFKNVAGRPEDAWLSTALSEMLTTELAAGEKLRTVPGENVAIMKINLSLTDADSYGKDTLSRIHTNLNADTVVVGSYVLLGKGQIRLDLRLQDTLAGETLASVSEKGAEDQMDLLVSRAGSTLREKLGAGAVSATEAAAVKATLPSNPEAARLFFEGLAELRAFNTQTGRDLLQKAIQIEPGFPLAHAELAGAWEHLGEMDKARAESQKAFELSSSLSPEERLSVEAQFRRMHGERDKAVQIYQSLFHSYPDNLNYGLNLAGAQHLAGKSKDATVTLEQLRKLPPPARDDPRIDLSEAEASEPLGDYKSQLAFADSAIEKARTQGARLLSARALQSRCEALQFLQQPTQAVAACEEAQRIYAQAGSRNDVAFTANILGAVLDMQGNHAAAKIQFEQARSIWQELGNQHNLAQVLNNLANFYDNQGDTLNARKMYEQSLALSRGFGDQLQQAHALHNIAILLANNGDLSGAMSHYQDSVSLSRAMGNNQMVLISLLPQCRLDYLMGQFANANHCLEEARPVIQETGNKGLTAYSLGIRSELLIAQDDLPAARKTIDEIQKLRIEIGNKATIVLSNRRAAALSIEEGNPAQAQAALQKILEEALSQKNVDSANDTRLVLARALLAIGKPSDAEKVFNAANAIPSPSDNFEDRLIHSIDSARIRAALGHRSEAEKILRAALAKAKTANYIFYEYEARLALCEAQVPSGNAASARSQIAALERDATAKGFLRVAAKARNLQSILSQKK